MWSTVTCMAMREKGSFDSERVSTGGVYLYYTVIINSYAPKDTATTRVVYSIFKCFHFHLPANYFQSSRISSHKSLYLKRWARRAIYNGLMDNYMFLFYHFKNFSFYTNTFLVPSSNFRVKINSSIGHWVIYWLLQ